MLNSINCLLIGTTQNNLYEGYININNEIDKTVMVNSSN